MDELKVVQVPGLFAEGVMPQWIVRGVLPEKGLMVVQGDPYTSKTFLALELCRAVASDSPFMGFFPVDRDGPALYVGEDSPTWDLVAQTRKLLAGNNQLVAWPEGLLFANKRGVSLDTDAGLERVLKAVEKHEPCLVVLDCLRELHDQDENDSQVMRRIMRRARKISEAEHTPAVVVIHHNSKPGQEGRRAAIHRGRGSTAVPGAADVVLDVSKGHEPERFHIDVGKSRSLALKGWEYDLVWSPDEARFEVHTDIGVEERAVLDALSSPGVDALGEGPILSTGQIEAIVVPLRERGGNANPMAVHKFVQRMLAQMMSKGLIQKVAHGQYALDEHAKLMDAQRVRLKQGMG